MADSCLWDVTKQNKLNRPLMAPRLFLCLISHHYGRTSFPLRRPLQNVSLDLEREALGGGEAREYTSAPVLGIWDGADGRPKGTWRRELQGYRKEAGKKK